MVSRNGGGGDGVEKEGRERGGDDGPTRGTKALTFTLDFCFIGCSVGLGELGINWTYFIM